MSSLGGFGGFSGVSGGFEDAVGGKLTAGSLDALTPDTLPPDSTLSTSGAGTPSAKGGSLWSDAQLNSGQPYNEYLIDASYETDSGIRQMALASNSGGGPSSAFVQVHAPVSRKVVRWTAERIGAPPILPHWDTGNANEIFLKKRIKPCSTFILPDGVTQVWRVEGVYLYGLASAMQDGDKMFAGSIPVANLSSSTQTIDGSLFSKAILQAA